MDDRIKIYGVVAPNDYWRMKREAVSGVRAWDKNIPKTLFADHASLAAHSMRVARNESPIAAS